MATDDKAPDSPDENATEPQAAANEQPTEAISAAATTPIEAAPVTAAAPAAPAPPAGSSGISTKNKLIAGAVGGGILVAGVFFGLGYWTGDATNDNDHHGNHHRMSNEWRGGGGQYGENGQGQFGPRMRHRMNGNGNEQLPPGMQMPGDGQDGNGQAPTNGQPPTTGQQAPTQAPAPSA